jgi:hypothetical protein
LEIAFFLKLWKHEIDMGKSFKSTVNRMLRRPWSKHWIHSTLHYPYFYDVCITYAYVGPLCFPFALLCIVQRSSFTEKCRRSNSYLFSNCYPLRWLLMFYLYLIILTTIVHYLYYYYPSPLCYLCNTFNRSIILGLGLYSCVLANLQKIVNCYIKLQHVPE